jgi:hypothetical protein
MSKVFETIRVPGFTVVNMTHYIWSENSILRRTNTACTVSVGLPEGAQQC